MRMTGCVLPCHLLPLARCPFLPFSGHLHLTSALPSFPCCAPPPPAIYHHLNAYLSYPASLALRAHLRHVATTTIGRNGDAGRRALQWMNVLLAFSTVEQTRSAPFNLPPVEAGRFALAAAFHLPQPPRRCLTPANTYFLPARLQARGRRVLGTAHNIHERLPVNIALLRQHLLSFAPSGGTVSWAGSCS